MVEEPNFEYKYNMAPRRSFAARLSLTILAIAACVFLVAMLAYLFFTEDIINKESTLKARMALHDAVTTMRIRAMEAKTEQREMSAEEYVDILQGVQPYEHSFTLMMDSAGKWVHLGDPLVQRDANAEQDKIRSALMSRNTDVLVVTHSDNASLLIYEPVPDTPYSVGVLCSRLDILMSYKTLIYYGGAAFLLGLLILFAFSAYAIVRMVRPLNQFAESARNIANGDLDTALPQIRTKDELLLLHDSFEYMQSSLKQYIKDLQETTAANEHMQSELTIAHNIQMSMISTDFPRRDDIDLYASMNPAREVGGDLYDFIVDGDELFFVIGDVSGKGVPASLYMAMTRSLFRQLAGNYKNAANIVREINHSIACTNDAYLFVTLFVGVLDMRNHVLSFSNAAHNPPVLVPDQGRCRVLEVMPQVPVGIIDRYQYEEQQIPFPPGSAILLYTDGLTEAENSQQMMFGEDRLLDEVETNRQLSARQLIENLNLQVGLFSVGMEQTDDLTMLFLRHQGKTEGRTTGRKILLKNEISELDRLHGFVSAVCQEMGTGISFQNDIDLALEEVVVNVIRYAYPKGIRGHVEVSAQTEHDTLILTVKDRGEAFDPTRTQEVDIDQPLEQRKIGGLGIHIVRKIMDRLHYQRTSDGYNILTMEIKLPPGNT